MPDNGNFKMNVVDWIMEKYGKANPKEEWFWIRMKDIDTFPLPRGYMMTTDGYDRYVLGSGNYLVELL